MAEYEDKTSAQQGGSEEPRNFMEDGEDAGVQEAVHVCVQEKNGKPISVVARLVHRRKLPSKGKRFTFSDAVNWMRQGGPAWRGFLISAVSSLPLTMAYHILNTSYFSSEQKFSFNRCEISYPCTNRIFDV
jgi:hypothetical protein